MSKPFRFGTAVSLIALSSVIAGCAAQQGQVAATKHFGGKADDNVGLATRAVAALNSNQVPLAIDLAERAVAHTPNDAGFRALLANAYFAGGRFRSAESAYKDSLALDSDQPQAILKLALVEIALGKRAEASQLLDAGSGMIDPADLGLALALAGRPADAIQMLQPAARQRGADSRVRQNLALAYALSGEWTQARIVAAQDVPASQLDSRIQQWMQLANPVRPSDQLAALVGVTPAQVDQGQPVQLALRKAETQVAQASPAPVAAPAPPPQFVQAAPLPPFPQFAEAAAPVPAPAPKPVPVAAKAPTPAPVTAALLSAASAVRDAVAAFVPHQAEPAAKPAKVRRAAAAAKPRRGNSPAVVQLGAYGSPQRVVAAWDQAAHKHGALKAFTPMSARFASQHGLVYRLSVKGFASAAEAIALCNSLRRSGGSCFVRNVAGDAPVQYAAR
jgi:D-alanyl-D-alanine carboxypeptidase